MVLYHIFGTTFGSVFYLLELLWFFGEYFEGSPKGDSLEPLVFFTNMLDYVVKTIYRDISL